MEPNRRYRFYVRSGIPRKRPGNYSAYFYRNGRYAVRRRAETQILSAGYPCRYRRVLRY